MGRSMGDIFVRNAPINWAAADQKRECDKTNKRNAMATPSNKSAPFEPFKANFTNEKKNIDPEIASYT